MRGGAISEDPVLDGGMRGGEVVAHVRKEVTRTLARQTAAAHRRTRKRASHVARKTMDVQRGFADRCDLERSSSTLVIATFPGTNSYCRKSKKMRTAW